MLRRELAALIYLLNMPYIHCKVGIIQAYDSLHFSVLLVQKDRCNSSQLIWAPGVIACLGRGLVGHHRQPFAPGLDRHFRHSSFPVPEIDEDD